MKKIITLDWVVVPMRLEKEMWLKIKRIALDKGITSAALVRMILIRELKHKR
jgi:predicted DNA-binding ribbon-helix-helix protein